MAETSESEGYPRVGSISTKNRLPCGRLGLRAASVLVERGPPRDRDRLPVRLAAGAARIGADRSLRQSPQPRRTIVLAAPGDVSGPMRDLLRCRLGSVRGGPRGRTRGGTAADP